MICSKRLQQLVMPAGQQLACNRIQAQTSSRCSLHRAGNELRRQDRRCSIVIRPQTRLPGLVVQAAAGPIVTEPSSGVEFPLVRTFWDGEAQRNLGAAVRQKKIAFLGVKVYAVAVFVEAERAAKELGVRERGGFFADNNNEDYVQAIVDGAFAKTLVITMTRKVEGEQFVGAIAEALQPRMQLMGELSTLEKFKNFFMSKPALEKGTTISLLWRVNGTLDILVRPSDESLEYARATPDERIESPSLCRALFEVYMGSSPVIPDAIGIWATGARMLLDSENERRSSRRGGA